MMESDTEELASAANLTRVEEGRDEEQLIQFESSELQVDSALLPTHPPPLSVPLQPPEQSRPDPTP